MANYWNGSGGSVRTLPATNVEEGTEPVELDVVEWEFTSTPVVDDKTAADSGGIREVSPQVVDIQGRFTLVWDSEQPPEASGLASGLRANLTLRLGLSDLYYYYTVLITSLSPRVNSRQSVAIEYSIAFQANGVQPDPRDIEDVGTVIWPGDLQPDFTEVVSQRPKTSSLGIEYRILHEGGGGYLESFGADCYTSTYICLVDFQKANLWAQDMLGVHYVNGAGTGFTRTNPEPHLYFPDLYCVHLELLRNYGPPDWDPAAQGMIRYDEVAYRATFQALPYQVLDDNQVQEYIYGESCRYVSVKMSPGVEAISRPGFGFQFIQNDDTPFVPSQPLQQPPAFLLAGVTFHLTLHYWPTGNFANFFALAGTVNEDAFFVTLRDGTLVTLPPETCLFQGWEPEFMPASVGDNTLWRHILHLAVKVGQDPSGNAATWNKVYHPILNEWLTIKGVTDNKKPVIATDFRKLFQAS